MKNITAAGIDYLEIEQHYSEERRKFLPIDEKESVVSLVARFLEEICGLKVNLYDQEAQISKRIQQLAEEISRNLGDKCQRNKSLTALCVAVEKYTVLIERGIEEEFIAAEILIPNEIKYNAKLTF